MPHNEKLKNPDTELGNSIVNITNEQYQRLLRLENAVSSLGSVMGRLQDMDDKVRELETILTYTVSMLLSMEGTSKQSAWRFECSKKVIRKWLSGNKRRNKMVSVTCMQMKEEE